MNTFDVPIENDYDIIRGLRSFLKSSGLVRHGVSDVDVVQSCNTKSASSRKPPKSSLLSLLLWQIGVK